MYCDNKAFCTSILNTKTLLLFLGYCLVLSLLQFQCSLSSIIHSKHNKDVIHPESQSLPSSCGRWLSSHVKVTSLVL